MESFQRRGRPGAMVTTVDESPSNSSRFGKAYDGTRPAVMGNSHPQCKATCLKDGHAASRGIVRQKSSLLLKVCIFGAAAIHSCMQVRNWMRTWGSSILRGAARGEELSPRLNLVTDVIMESAAMNILHEDDVQDSTTQRRLVQEDGRAIKMLKDLINGARCGSRRIGLQASSRPEPSRRNQNL
jgi:hypothetical protein